MTQHFKRFNATPGLELHETFVPAVEGTAGRTLHGFGLKDGIRAEEIEFPSPGYADAAIESFALFREMKASGAFAPSARFEIAMATPFATLCSFIESASRDALEPTVTEAFRTEVERLLVELPHDEIAVQWDVATELILLEGAEPVHLAEPHAEIVDRLVAIGGWIPDDVPLGYHFCYGTQFGVHHLDPEDTGLMVRLANDLVGRLERPVSRLHMPVPPYRDDTAFYTPLRELKLGGTDLFLGLINPDDGVEGARRRAAAAKTALSRFGVATECGTGRTVAESVRLMRLHQAVAKVVDEPLDDVEVEPGPKARRPYDADRVNAELYALAEKQKCPECGAQVGKPCLDKRGEMPPRPHGDRWHNALLDTVKEQREAATL
jgi:hypothetical protein